MNISTVTIKYCVYGPRNLKTGNKRSYGALCWAKCATKREVELIILPLFLQCGIFLMKRSKNQD